MGSDAPQLGSDAPQLGSASPAPAYPQEGHRRVTATPKKICPPKHRYPPDFERQPNAAEVELAPRAVHDSLVGPSEDEHLLALKRKWEDGTTHILLSKSELLGRLAALVPPKGFNLTRYHGCLAPRSSLRDLIVPAPPAREAPAPAGERPQEPPVTGPARPRRIPWRSSCAASSEARSIVVPAAVASSSSHL